MIKSIIGRAFAIFPLSFLVGANANGGSPPLACAVARHGTELALSSAAFTYRLDTAQGLRALSWQNELDSRQVSLGLGSELSLDFDAADRRVWISGWKHEGPGRTTHLFLPSDAKGKQLTLTLGGFGLYDYREIEVQLNGQEIGMRHAAGRWREPGGIDLGPGSKIYPYLRFGQDNVLVCRCQSPILRTERMDQLGVDLDLPLPAQWPAQFEQYLTIGTPLQTPVLQVKAVRDETSPEQGKLEVELESESGDVNVVVTYRWNATEPVLHKFVEARNQSSSQRRLMNVRLGDYQTDTDISDGEQGFPVYLGDTYFMSLAHPSGWAIGQKGHILLRQYPGRMLAPGERFQAMEVVMGVARSGKARQSFLDHVRDRSRRALRKHDKPYAIYETFGANMVNGQASDEYQLNENYSLAMLSKLAAGQKETGYHFDYACTEFWVDYAGDLEQFDPIRFPHGFTNIRAKLEALGIQPGLWIDSSWKPWTISSNPVVNRDFTHDPAYENGLYGMASLCRATDPIRTMYSTAFAHHIRQNGVRLIKTDNLHSICYNPNHPHLPGVYSTEAIQSAVIQTLREWDAVNPDVFIMLYWGYRSPWWLLDGDTISEHGFHIEAASPGPWPTLYARDGVARRIDQGQQWREDVPVLGKDTLGIWLSDWAWNTHIGKERWQEGMVMDLGRGSLLAQIWTDYDWLSEPERRQLADFIALLKARPECFGNPRLILGDLWKEEPYGYCCTDGRRAFVAVNNSTWSDISARLELNAKWGLPGQGRWAIYRWYPNPALLAGPRGVFEQTANISLRPFQVVLLEIVPEGEAPTLGRRFNTQPIPSDFREPSLPVPVSASPKPGGGWQATGQAPAHPNGGTLVVSIQLRRDGRPYMIDDAKSLFSCRGTVGGREVSCVAVAPGPASPATWPWEAWRIALQPATNPEPIELVITSGTPGDVKLSFAGHFIPID